MKTSTNSQPQPKKAESHNIKLTEAKLRPKTKAFADTIISNPKISHTQAYLNTHETTNRKAASVEATKTLAKPSVQIYMDKHISKAKRRMVELVDSDKENIALQASEAILDRALGKATSRTEVNTTNLNMNIEADMKLSEDFTAFLKQKTYLDPS